MTLVLLHSPKGGVGTTFLAANIAMQLAARGHEVTAIDFTYQDALKLYLGVPPDQPLNSLADANADPLVIAGVQVAQGFEASRQPEPRRALHAGDMFRARDRVFVADLAACDRELKATLMPHVTLHVCALLPRPASLAALSKVDPETPVVALEKTVFVLNQLDDRQRLSRDSHSFVRQLLGDQLIGTVRRDEALNESIAMFEPLAKFASTSVLLTDIAMLTDAVARRCGLAGRADDTDLRASA